MIQPYKGINITFVPNSFCNFACSYCYLGKHCDIDEPTEDVALQFKNIAKKLKDEGKIICKVTLHGAEFTAMKYDHAKLLLEAIEEYRIENQTYIIAFSKNNGSYIHTKTNLYNFDIFEELFKKYKVGVSASVDLPLRLHEKNRVLKSGKNTLPKVLDNIKKLAQYPYFSQISTTMSAEYLEANEFISDVYKLDRMGFDMVNNFYIMFAYESSNARYKKEMAKDENIVKFYYALREKLKDTKFEAALELLWFKEFLGGYCTQCVNCGDQVLIQKNGDCYTCHRSQPFEDFKAGNILENTYDDIIEKNYRNVQKVENTLDLHDDCKTCEYFYNCVASCVIERRDTKLGKSYTCALQKAIYKNNSDRFPKNKELSQQMLDQFLRENQIDRDTKYLLPSLNPEFFDPKNNIYNLIENDETLKAMYSEDNFFIWIEDEIISTNTERRQIKSMLNLNSNSRLRLLIKKSIFNINTKYPHTGTLRIFLLRNTYHVYGDEQRTKMQHMADYMVSITKLEESQKEYIPGFEDYFIYDLMPFIVDNKEHFIKDIINLLCFTTLDMRKYHYDKHSMNAFYHAQAINLPFDEMEFLWTE